MIDNRMSCALKAMALPFSGGVSLGLLPLMLGGEFADSEEPFFIFFTVGALMSAVIGLPLLFVVEKFFSGFWYRYVLGGVLCGLLIFVVVDTPLHPDDWHLWFDSQFWIKRNVGRKLMLFLGVGLAAGCIYTAVVNLIDRLTGSKTR